MRWGLEFLASLRLTVALLVLAMLVVFLGTLAQTRVGVWQAVEAYFRAPIAWVDPGMFLGNSDDSGAWIKIPIPGGLAIVSLMIVNLLAAHIIRFRATWKRAGIITLHLGLVLLLVGELVTGFLSTEGLMSIDEGSSSSILEDIREVELAVLDSSDPNMDRVVTVPGAFLVRAARSGAKIEDDRLPFEVTVDRWMPNAELVRAPGGGVVTDGVGLGVRAEELPRVTGVEGGQADSPAAIVTLSEGGERIGTWLVSASLSQPQRVEIREAVYGLSLRYRRTYLPFTVHLQDFRHDVFAGTTIPKNFSSDVRIVDPVRQTDREVRIWMNHPLRYGGLTFYQASYKPDGSGTVLQVVRNPGWLLPYLSCALVGGGMLLHFGMALTAYLRRRVKRQAKTIGATAGQGPTRLWPWLVGACGVLIAVSSLLRPYAQSGLDLRAMGEIPVLSGGRIKPLDTAARSMLLVAGGRRQAGSGDDSMGAVEYLLELIVRPERVADLPVVRVDHPDVLSLIGLGPDEGGRVGLALIEPHWGGISEQASRAAAVPARSRDGFQRAVLQLHNRVNSVLAFAQMREPFAIAPLGPEGSWRSFHEAFLDGRATGEDHPSVAYIGSMMSAASEGDVAGFNGAASGYTSLLNDSMPGVMRRSKLEVAFNRASLFDGAAGVYVLALLLVCGSFILRAREGPRWAERLRVAGVSLLVGALFVHTIAIGLRIYLQGRPPVTNLYSSAVFVGWASVLVGLLVERLHPLGVGALCSAVIGCGTLIVAHNLGNDGDTMEMMQAVLDSNFWLATHVIVITLGYSATFLGGAIAAVYLLGRGLTRAITREREQMLGRMVYGVVCFALLLSFVGTVLGGIWADQSWGRFWGWDPKENGAALVVLINALILHARWGGLVRTRGVAMLAVAGNIVTAWSWFGTNMLGVGLHAYGFTDGAGVALGAFVASQLAIIGLGAGLGALSGSSRPSRRSGKLAGNGRTHVG